MQRWRHAGAGLYLGVFALVVAAQTPAGGPISADTVWHAAQSPYVVASDLLVQNGATLTIEAGTTVYMGAGTRFTVQSGALKAIGTAQAPIRLTSQKLQNGHIPAPGDWQQLTFSAGVTSTTKLEYVQIEYGQGLVLTGASPTFNYLTITNNQGAAISADLAASPSGAGNQASGNGSDAIVLPAGDINGSITWGLRGIPFLVAQGAVSVGASPSIASISPPSLQQGETQTFTLTGVRLSGLSQASFDLGGLSAQPVAGASDVQAQLLVTATPGAALGLANLTALVDAGEVRRTGALSVKRIEPKLLAVTPAFVYAGRGDQLLDIAGQNLLATTVAALDGEALPSTYGSATRLSALLSNQASNGVHVLRLRTPDPLNAAETLWSEPLSITVASPQASLVPALVSTLQGSARQVTMQLPFAVPEPGLVFDLISSAPLVASVPANVTVPPGELAATFAVQGVAAGSAVLSLSRPGWLATQANVSVWSAQTQLLAEYRLDEAIWTGTAKEVKDNTANANHGVAVNGAVTAPAKLCAGGSFDGITNRHVVLPEKIQDLAVNTFTMMLWVKPGRSHELDAESASSTAGVSGQNYALFPTLNTAKWNWDSSGYAGAGLSVGTNGISVYEHAGNYMPPLLVWAGAVSASNWTHVAVTYNNGFPSLYVNGVFRKTGVKGSHANVVPTYVIGSANYGNYSLGVDEYKIFGGALPAADIAAVYANENAGMNWDGTARTCASAP